MRRLALLALGAIALLLLLIFTRPAEEQVRDLCFDALLQQGLDPSDSRGTIEYFEGFWTARGEAQGRRWSCTVHQWFGWVLRMEDVTIYPPGE